MVADNELTIRDALITIFNATSDINEGGSLGINKWYRRAEDGINSSFNRRSPFGYVEWVDRLGDDESSDLSNIGYFYSFEIGVVDDAASNDAYKADDKVTALLAAIETVLIANPDVSSNVDDLIIPIEKEMVRGRITTEDLFSNVSWGVLRVKYKKQITAR